MPGLTVRDVVAVHRLEFPFWVNDLCQAAWGACFAVTAVSGLLDGPALLAIGANVLLIVAGLVANSAADIDTDRRHRERARLAGSARRLGRERGMRLAAAELAVAVVLSTVVAVWTGRWLVVAVALVIVVLHVLYNIEPVRLKRKGFLGVTAFCTAVVGLPCVLSYTAVRPDFAPEVWPVFAGLTVLAIGRMTWWSVPDLGADAATGMATPSVRYGAVRSLALSCGIMLGGLLLLGGGLWLGYGLLAAVLGCVAHLAFLYGALGLLLRMSRGAEADSRSMRKRAMPLVMVGDLVVAAIPLASLVSV